MAEYELSDKDFEKISNLVYQKCGINLHGGKKELVSARLGKRLREGGFSSFSNYYNYITGEKGAEELVTMIDSISTNLTYFFREESHFVKLSKLLPVFSENAAKQKSGPKLLVWCAGCSTGEEPYSVAMTARESLRDQSVKVKILATDISTKVISKASEGIYSVDKAKNIPNALLNKYFQRGSGNLSTDLRVKEEIRGMISFKLFNLMHTPPAEALFDFIFCRNVMIYFDKQTQQRLVGNFFNCLKKGGYFFIGHSESLTGLNHSFKYVEPSVYTK
ncbi:MAG: protein-glutamate O-methyltransferase [Candidatus Aminicenantes bacterium]|nr:protein-glutamate O-methyltransferase [Candidatus Aminicenantes bacterium]